jgi:hypothetical protein
MKKVSRRELARILAALPAMRALPLGAQAPERSGYIGPLTGITKGLDDRGFDPVAFTRDLYAAAPRRLRFQARTRGQAEEWQQQLRAKLTDLIGAFPSQRQPLRPVTLETRAFPGYRREKIGIRPQSNFAIVRDSTQLENHQLLRPTNADPIGH